MPGMLIDGMLQDGIEGFETVGIEGIVMLGFFIVPASGGRGDVNGTARQRRQSGVLSSASTYSSRRTCGCGC